jgi:hypothetical protein
MPPPGCSIGTSPAGRGPRVAFRCGHEALTYAGLQRATWAAAHGFRALGVGPGDRVLMLVSDELAFPAAFLAGLRIGAIPIPVVHHAPGRRGGGPPRRLGRQGDRGLRASRRRSGGPLRTGIVRRGRGGHRRRRRRTGRIQGGAGRRSGAPLGRLRGPLRRPRPRSRRCRPPPTPPASGSTPRAPPGKPKAAIHRHGDIKAVCDTYGRSVLGIGPDDVCYSVPKLFFAFGLGNGLFFPLAVGASAVIDPEPPNPARAADLLASPPAHALLRPARVLRGHGRRRPARRCPVIGAGDRDRRRNPARRGAPPLYRPLRHRDARRGSARPRPCTSSARTTPATSVPGWTGRPVAGYELRLLDESGAVITEPDTPGALLGAGGLGSRRLLAATGPHRLYLRGRLAADGGRVPAFR